VFLKRQVASSRKEILRRGAMENRNKQTKKGKKNKLKEIMLLKFQPAPLNWVKFPPFP
jgi:hypothetical protein